MIGMFEICERVPIVVSRMGSEPNLDRASEKAYQKALEQFGYNDCGYLDNVKDFCRSTDDLHVGFVSQEHIGGMGGQRIVYRFLAWVERCEE